MTSLSAIDGNAAPGRAEIATSAVTAVDLLDAVDDRTLALLRRPPAQHRRRLMPRMLIGADMVGLALAYLLAAEPWKTAGGGVSISDLTVFALSLPGWVWLGHLQGLYHRDDERPDHCTTDDVVGVFYLVTIGVWLLFVGSRLAGLRGPAVPNLVGFWVIATVAVPLFRTVARRAAKRGVAYAQNTVIVGAGDVGQLIARKLVKHPEYGANVVGFVDRAPKGRRDDLPDHLSILGTPERLPEIIRRLDVERVIIAFSGDSPRHLLASLRPLRAIGIQVDLVPWLFELVGPRVSVHTVEGLPLIGLPPSRHSSASLAAKRLVDVAASSVALVLAAPIIAFIALRVKLDSPGPVLFRQQRLGAAMQEFTALKFRTMKVGTDPTAHRDYIRESMTTDGPRAVNGLYKLDRADAITKFGGWLRKTSLDELPQLINVLKGDMSLVGPRPCIPYEAENFGPHQLERFQMPQGITGLWQVTARANSTYLEALELDIAYVRDWSLGLDLRLLLRTPLALIRQRGSTA